VENRGSGTRRAADCRPRGRVLAVEFGSDRAW
jgi:hypothetical protein